MFASLHGTPGRMKRVGVIREVVEWRHSRKYFYWRLRKKLIDLQGIKLIEKRLNIDNGIKEYHEWLDRMDLNSNKIDDKRFVNGFKKKENDFERYLNELTIKNKNNIMELKNELDELKKLLNKKEKEINKLKKGNEMHIVD